MDKRQAFKAGLIGGAAMTVLMALGSVLGLTEVSHEMLLGTLLGLRPSSTTWLVGLLMHLTLSGFVALLYAVAFEYWLFRANWRMGVALAVLHSLAAGLFSRLLASFHPLIPESMPAPGPMWSNFGADDTVMFIAARLLFGAMVGAIYQPHLASQLQHPAKPQDDHNRAA